MFCFVKHKNQLIQAQIKIFYAYMDLICSITDIMLTTIPKPKISPKDMNVSRNNMNCKRIFAHKMKETVIHNFRDSDQFFKLFIISFISLLNSGNKDRSGTLRLWPRNN
jgi:hypothetical protein